MQTIPPTHTAVPLCNKAPVKMPTHPIIPNNIEMKTSGLTFAVTSSLHFFLFSFAIIF
jgi:hypothetical protein